MEDLAHATAVEGGDGTYHACLSEEWAIWGPMGGYVAAFLLRAAGAHSRFDRPATFACHYLAPARFEVVDIEVETVRAGRRSESVRATMLQGGRPVCTALIWLVDGDTDAPSYDQTVAPEVAPPLDALTVEELAPDRQRPFAFWDNLEQRPIDFLGEDEWLTARPVDARWRAWLRFRPTPRFDDPFVEASRVVIVCDLAGWPAVVRGLSPGEEERWIAPNIDLSVTFHQPPGDSEFLLADTRSQLVADGLGSATSAAWADDGRLLASSTAQLMFRQVPAT